MKKVLTFAMLGVLAGNAWAEEAVEPKIIAPYLSLGVGAGALTAQGQDGSNGGVSLNGAFGARFILNDQVSARAEVELSVGAFTGDLAFGNTVHHTPVAFMTNYYLDLLTGFRLKPYVGFGVGFMSLNEEMKTASGWTVYSENDSGFAYGLYGGIGFNLTSSGNVMGDLGLRHVSAQLFGHTIQTTTFNLGARFVF